MRRRRFLAALGGSASLGLGGLLAYRASRTRTLSVASVDTYDVALRLYEREPRDLDLHRSESLDSNAASAVEAAIEGGYETDSPSRELADFLDWSSFVRHEGSVYRLSDDFPRIVVTAEPYDGDASDLSVASTERFEANVVHRFGEGEMLAEARLDGAVDRLPAEEVRQFFERFDAVRIAGRLFRFSVTRRYPGPPYSLTAERVSASAARDARSVSLSDLPASVREQIRRGIERDPHVFGLVDPPTDLVDELRAKQLLRADGDHFSVDAWSVSQLPLDVSASLVEAGIGFKNPARLSLTLTNDGDEAVELHASSANPFGTLQYRPVDGGESRYLYSLADRSSSMWASRGGYHGQGRNELRPGEERSGEFALGGDAVGVPPGEYVIDGQIGTDHGIGGGDFPFRVTLQIE